MLLKRTVSLALSGLACLFLLSPAALAKGTDKTEWYYKQLNSQEKQIYSALVNAIDSISNSAAITTGTQPEKQSLQRVFSAIAYEQPEKFWIGGWGVSIDLVGESTYKTGIIPSVNPPFGSKNSGTLKPSTLDKALIKSTREKATSTAKKLISSLSGSSYNKLLGLNKALINHSDYDVNITEDSDDKSSYSMPGALLEKSAVCHGYALAFKFMCDYMNIPCVFIPGNAYSSTTGEMIPHAWNYVQLDGAWYQIDSTWNDPVGNSAPGDEVKFFLVGSDTVIDGMKVSSIYKPDSTGFKLPTLSKTSYSPSTAAAAGSKSAAPSSSPAPAGKAAAAEGSSKSLKDSSSSGNSADSTNSSGKKVLNESSAPVVGKKIA